MPIPEMIYLLSVVVAAGSVLTAVIFMLRTVADCRATITLIESELDILRRRNRAQGLEPEAFEADEFNPAIWGPDILSTQEKES